MTGGRDMPEATDVVDRQVAAYRDRDLERFLACYAADVKVKDFDGNVLMDGGRQYLGSLREEAVPLLARRRRFDACDVEAR